MKQERLDQIVRERLDEIAEGKFDAKGLQAIHENVGSHPSITDEQREELIDAIVLRMRKDFPSVAKKKFGPANRKTRELLEHALKDLVERYDWSDNRHKTKVKTGGDVIKGEAIVSDYISYKSPTGWMCALGFSQLTPDDPLLVGYSINFKKGEEANNNRMPAEMFEHALAEFEADLKSILEGTPTFRNVDESFAEYAIMDTISAEAADRILQDGYELRKK